MFPALSKLRLLLTALFCSLFLSAQVASAMGERVIEASSLYTCMENSKLTADRFKVLFTPSNNSVAFTLNITAALSGYVTADIDVYAYGFKIITEKFNPCSLDGAGLCPVYPGTNYVSSTYTVSDSIVKDIPGIAYTFPDIDAVVVVLVHDSTNNTVACIQAELSNRRSVAHVAVKWVTAVIAGIGLLTSAIISTMGNSYTAAHIAANSVSLFAYFQSVVIISMLAVDRMPTIASSWAQNLAWSVGLIRVTFMQKIFRWYVKATGGEPSENIDHPTISVLIQKRDQILTQLTSNTKDLLHYFAARLETNPYTSNIYKRALASSQLVVGINSVASSTDTLLVFRGIKRMAYQANIEVTSIVLTSFTFFVLIGLAVALCFSLFYLFVRFALPQEKFPYFRANWSIMLKGTILRLLFIACPSLFIFSLWEFIQRDSAAVIVLAVFFLTLSIGILGWSATKVYLTGNQSMREHDTPAYLLFSDPSVLNRYGFLYVPFKAFSFYYIIPLLGYFFVKSCFVAFAQASGKTQALAFFIIEIAYFATLCWFKPYMDKSTNIINIIIGVVMLINSFLFLFFSHLFGQPSSVSSVMGIIFFLLNAIFSLVLLIYTLVTCSIVLFTKNPDSRYKPASDDRAAFIKDQKGLGSGEVAELTALGAAARADHEADFGNDVNGRYSDSASLSSSNYDQEGKRKNASNAELNAGLRNAPPSSNDSNSMYSYSNPFSEKPRDSGANNKVFEVDDSFASLPSATNSATLGNNSAQSTSGLLDAPRALGGSGSNDNLTGSPRMEGDGFFTPPNRLSNNNSEFSAGASPVTHTYTNTSSINHGGANLQPSGSSNNLRPSTSQSRLTEESGEGAAASPTSPSKSGKLWKKLF